MTNANLRAAVLGAALFGASPALAADSAPMTSTALLLKPLTLTKLSDLDFGTIIPSGAGDFVTINAVTGARTSPTANLVPTGPGKRARFASSGVNNVLVFLELSPPPYAALTNAAGNKLKVEYINLDGPGVRILTPASQVFFVGIGGEIFVRSNQEDGAYTGSFTLTANYL
jgi:hypothetical protein